MTKDKTNKDRQKNCVFNEAPPLLPAMRRGPWQTEEMLLQVKPGWMGSSDEHKKPLVCALNAPLELNSLNTH